MRGWLRRGFSRNNADFVECLKENEDMVKCVTVWWIFDASERNGVWSAVSAFLKTDIGNRK
jgi:hypothetical protein